MPASFTGTFVHIIEGQARGSPGDLGKQGGSKGAFQGQDFGCFLSFEHLLETPNWAHCFTGHRVRLTRLSAASLPFHCPGAVSMPFFRPFPRGRCRKNGTSPEGDAANRALSPRAMPQKMPCHEEASRTVLVRRPYCHVSSQNVHWNVSVSGLKTFVSPSAFRIMKSTKT